MDDRLENSINGFSRYLMADLFNRAAVRPQPNRESSEKEFQPRIYTDAHGIVEIELLSVRIRVYPWFLIFFSSGENLRKKQNFRTLVARMGTDKTEQKHVPNWYWPAERRPGSSRDKLSGKRISIGRRP